jgi:hypothetical protein
LVSRDSCGPTWEAVDQRTIYPNEREENRQQLPGAQTIPLEAGNQREGQNTNLHGLLPTFTCQTGGKQDVGNSPCHTKISYQYREKIPTV